MALYPGATTFPSAATFPSGRPRIFRPPTKDLAFRIEGGLFGLQALGLSVWRTGGVWHQGFIPTAEQVAASDRFYGGGRIHELTQAEVDDLTAGGYGAYITEENT